MKIRKARKKDVEQLAKLYLQFWEAHKKPSPLHVPKIKLNYKNLLKDAKETIKDKEIFTFVAEENGKIMGHISFMIKNSHKYFKIRKYGYIDEVVVDKKYRGKGISRKLMDFAVKFLKNKGVRYIQLKVEMGNKHAQQVWEKMGFKRDSIEYIREVK